MTVRELRGYFLDELRQKDVYSIKIHEKIPVMKESGSSEFVVREIYSIEYVEWLEKRFIDLVTP
jgi:hypothetical protein